MTSISSNEEFISVISSKKTFVILLKNSELFCVDHSSVKIKDINNLESSDSDEVGLGLLCSDISPHDNKLAFSTLSKTLCVVEVTDSGVTIQNVFELARGASKVKFTPSGKYIVVADKSGDVYLFDLLKENNVGELILGHLSLLLDVLVTQDEKYIVTCDRDEKIRVSSFPNGYNIIAYCLGHGEFVSSINFLPHNNSVLVSTSGDASVRFWDFKIGEEVMIFDTMSHLDSSTECQSRKEIAAITDAVTILVDKCTSLVCIALEDLKLCLVLKCTSTPEKKELKCSLNQIISLQDSSPWRITFSSNHLWFILNSHSKTVIKVMSFNPRSCTFGNDIPKHFEKTVNSLNSQELTLDFKKNIVHLLYKRKFDNVQEYLVKKEARLITSLEPVTKRMKKHQLSLSQDL